MKVKYLSPERLRIRNVGVAAAKVSVVRNNNHLKHVIVKSEGHLIKRAHISVERRNSKYIRYFTEGRRQL